MIGLQEMVLQTDGNDIRVLPAWPEEWQVDFKLYAPHNTVVSANYYKNINKMDIFPGHRKEDVIKEGSKINKTTMKTNTVKKSSHLRNKNLLFGGILFLLVTQACYTQNYVFGADLSFAKQAKENGFEFKEDGAEKPFLEIFKEHGYNWIRLRLFHNPNIGQYNLPNDLDYTIQLAKEAKKQGFKFLLDYHYSDTWADLAKQYTPKAWEGKTGEELVKEVFEYTKTTMLAFRDAGVFPDMVQVGNEISNGMLWPFGKLPENWDGFAALLQSGINGVYASCGNNPCPEIMIHIDKGGDKDFTKYFFDKIETYGIKFDVIGQSYYPWWHGSLLDFRECLNFTANTYQKDIVVVEVAYNYARQEYKDKKAPFPETPQGQKEFLEAVNKIILNVSDGRGKGLFWWEPAAPNKGFSTRTFFSPEGDVMPAITVFDKYVRY
ncbi:glycosyl hydrolase 53 family protein [Aureibaculum sp. 2210JD6-5]|uniref:glycoside hydrolase family 53 protein n=1 Tax=Aureibaculum sp. 2210JD6-5 TaxID=3103957 RepID=UPI002AAE445F|nr:glycosyl hydrolase 53 family protein [Aureibaculum sp. 2210JD6-5]MDY7396321.1 glycosyl hydrolase 53 family protein [Aureibaculum sp. 2210JD6-5]